MGSYRNQKNTKFYKINQYINHPEIRLLDEEGKQIGVMTMSEARTKAYETGLDLVEINGSSKPPVVKLISFSKFKYQESKKTQAEKKGTKGGDVKEIQMSPFIGQSDYETRLKKTQKFLSTGNKVKLSIKFLGRQIQRKEFGYDLVNKYLSDLKEYAVPESEARFMGKRLIITLTPVKKTTKQKQDEKTK